VTQQTEGPLQSLCFAHAIGMPGHDEPLVMQLKAKVPSLAGNAQHVSLAALQNVRFVPPPPHRIVFASGAVSAVDAS
jgi:hypothetical protein